MGGFSIWHILLLALLVMLLFGGNRFSAMMGDVAKGLKNFKAGMADDDGRTRLPSSQQPRPSSDRTIETPTPFDGAERRQAPPAQDPRV